MEKRKTVWLKNFQRILILRNATGSRNFKLQPLHYKLTFHRLSQN